MITYEIWEHKEGNYFSDRERFRVYKRADFLHSLLDHYGYIGTENHRRTQAGAREFNVTEQELRTLYNAAKKTKCIEYGYGTVKMISTVKITKKNKYKRELILRIISVTSDTNMWWHF